MTTERLLRLNAAEQIRQTPFKNVIPQEVTGETQTRQSGKSRGIPRTVAAAPHLLIDGAGACITAGEP
jgi:hypothetical protein